MTLTDVLVIVGFIVTGIVFVLQKDASEQRDLEAALAVLRALRDGTPWGDLYFTHAWTEETARDRADRDYASIKTDRGHGQIFVVPTELFSALFASPAAGGLIHRRTLEKAGIALWKMKFFNQLVQQQTDFNARYLPEIVDPKLPQERREALAQAAFKMSYMIHADAIGDARWYGEFAEELNANIQSLEEECVGRRWLRRLRSLVRR